MKIANPIYDVVFKYLMEDPESAKLLLGEILQEEIVELKFLPQESALQIDKEALKDLPTSIQDEIKKGGQLNIYLQRMDFTAMIKTKTGKLKKVLIEIQKARYWEQIQRFRRYLGNAYLQRDVDGEHRPIIAIYFLGKPLKSTKVPVLRVENQLVDVILDKKVQLAKEEESIDLLMHKGIIIQIPYLKNRHRSKLEEFLSVFEQRKALQNDVHFLELDPETYPKEYRAVVRRLARAASTVEIRRNMDLEDEAQEMFATQEKKLEEEQRKLEEEQRKGLEKDKKLEEKDKALEEQSQALKEQSQALEEQSQALAQKDKMIISCVLALHRSGESVEKIMEKTQLTHGNIQTIIQQETKQ